MLHKIGNLRPAPQYVQIQHTTNIQNLKSPPPTFHPYFHNITATVSLRKGGTVYKPREKKPTQKKPTNKKTKPPLKPAT